jgi:hypothetical protein
LQKEPYVEGNDRDIGFIAMDNGIPFEGLNHESMAQELTQMNEKINMLEIGDLNHVPQATFT